MTIQSIKKHPDIIPGEYDGLFTAYNLKIIFHNGNHSDSIKMDGGYRGANIGCKVIVDKDGLITEI